jgi:PAS domain S-box-containing protein
VPVSPKKVSADPLNKVRARTKLARNSGAQTVTKQKQTGLRTGRTPRQWEATFNAITDLVAIIDKDFRIIKVNQAFAHALGTTPQKLVGRKCYEMVHGSKEPWVSCPHKQALQRSKPAIEEFWEPHLGRHVQVSVSPIFNDKDEMTSSVHIVRDISERNNSEEALRQSEERFRLTFDQSPIGTALLETKKGHFARTNKAFCRFTGYSEEELAQLAFKDITYPDDLAMSLEQTRQVLAGEIDGFEMEKRYVRKDGSTAWGHLSVQVMKDSSGRIPYTLAMIQDITARKQAEEALRESEERYRTAIEHSNDGVAVIKDGVYIFLNQKFLELFGYQTPEGLLGKAVADAAFHLHPEDRDRLIEMDRRRQRGEPAPSRYEFKTIRGDGAVLYLESSIAGIVYEGGLADLIYLRDITKRRQAELRLRESEEAMKSLLNATSDVACLIDTEGTLIAANGFLAQRLGKSTDDLIGRNIFDFFPEELARTRQLWARKAIESSRPVRFEDTSLDKNRYFDSCIYPLFDAGGTVARLAVYARDITEARLASQALAESEVRFKQFFNSVNDGISVRDATTYELMDANRRFCEMYGYTLEELKALPLGSLAANESADERRRRLGAHYARVTAGVSRLFQAEGRRKDGTTFWVEVNVRRIIVGGRECLLAVARDITERREAEEALRESEARFRQLFDSVNDGIVVRDAETLELLDANRRFCEMWGYTLEELKELPLGSIGAYESVEERRKRLIAYYAQAAKGIPSLFQWAARRKDGSTFWVELNGTRITIGTRDCLLLVVRDVTERKRAEEKIRASLKEKEVLLREIHHRVKNNLQIISSLLYLQSTRTEHAGAVSALRESRARIKSMALIHERLYASADLASVDMGKYTRNLVSDLRHSLGTEESSVHLKLNIDDIPLGITEAIPCGLIINELVSNALKHAFPKGRDFHRLARGNLSSEHGEREGEAPTALPVEGATRAPVAAGEISIQLLRTDANRVTLTVSDNGIGFPEQIDFRKSPSLGLTLVNSLVEQLGGTIELDRREGTSFTITFG